MLQDQRVTISGCLSSARFELEALGDDEAKVSAERILAELLNCSRSALYLHWDRELSADLADTFRRQIQERKTRKPLAYILGAAYFWNERLSVGSGCLIPRPETELLVESVMKRCDKHSSFSFVDIGTGSGAIAVALLRYFPKAQAVLSDVSEQALEFARKNLLDYGLIDRAEIVRSDLFDFAADRQWDLIVSNPPYVAEKDWNGLQPELSFEPREALTAGMDGMDVYKRLVPQAAKHLKPKGFLALELGIGQSADVKRLLEEASFHSITIEQDYSEIDRVIGGQLG